MGNREAVLCSVGVAVREHSFSDVAGSLEETNFSAYADWLEQNMFSTELDPHSAAETVVSKLMDYAGTTEHSHQFLMDKCTEIGLRVEALEGDQRLEEGILSVHHWYMASFARSNSIKIIDNSNDETWIVHLTGQA
jgi:hypothetical protein